ncbi:MAG: hypothetical protein WCT06_03580 [Armatimonadota bacterium]
MTLLTVFVGIIAFCNILLLISIAFLVFSISRLVGRSVVPAVGEVQSTVKKVNGIMDNVGDRASKIMDIGENTARKVSGKVVATTGLLENTAAAPIISVSSIIAGITKAVQVWRESSAQSEIEPEETVVEVTTKAA